MAFGMQVINDSSNVVIEPGSINYKVLMSGYVGVNSAVTFPYLLDEPPLILLSNLNESGENYSMLHSFGRSGAKFSSWTFGGNFNISGAYYAILVKTNTPNAEQHGIRLYTDIGALQLDGGDSAFNVDFVTSVQLPVINQSQTYSYALAAPPGARRRYFVLNDMTGDDFTPSYVFRTDNEYAYSAARVNSAQTQLKVQLTTLDLGSGYPNNNFRNFPLYLVSGYIK